MTCKEAINKLDKNIYCIYNIHSNVRTSTAMCMVNPLRMVSNNWIISSSGFYNISMYYFTKLNYENKESQQ